MSAESFTSCERLLSATANGVYQGVLVTVLAGLTLRMFPRTNAATRHAIWFGVLLLVTALIPAHLLLSSNARPEILAETTPMAMNVDAAPAPLDEGIPSSPTVAEDPIAEPQPVAHDGSAEIHPAGWSFPRAILKLFSWNLETAISLPHSICLALVCAWVLLAGVRGGLIARQIGEVRRVKRTAIASSQVLQALFDRLRLSLAARRNVVLRISSTHRSAVVLGFAHPVVLLPTEMDQGVNDSEVEQVLRHELAHVNRRDDWGNLAQQMIQAALFFHPAVWWISARISLEREIACDDHVLEASRSPRTYALTLANVASRMSHCRHLLAPGVSSNNSQLQQRITMILNTNRDASPRLAKSRLGLFTTATAVLAVLAITAGPRLVLAQSLPATAATASTIAAAPSSFASATAPVVASDGLPPEDPVSESGPRIKRDTGNGFATPAPVAAVPMPAMPPMDPVAGVRPVAPMPPAPPLPRGHKKNMSIEDRLDRLERALEELEAHHGAKVISDGGGSYSLNSGGRAMGFSRGWSADSKTEMELKQAADEMKRAMEEAQRNMEAGQRAAQASQRSAELAMRDMAKLKTKDYERMQQKYSAEASEAPLRELEALRSARESLEKELQNLSRQIKRLEQDQKHPKDPAHVERDNANGDSKPENPAAAK